LISQTSSPPSMPSLARLSQLPFSSLVTHLVLVVNFGDLKSL
jgi:hypothetical protein